MKTHPDCAAAGHCIASLDSAGECCGSGCELLTEEEARQAEADLKERMLLAGINFDIRMRRLGL